jgi:hypothetical protein
MGQSMQTRALSIRLPVGLAEDLETLAYFDRCSVAEEIRQAITIHIKTRREDPHYIEQMQQELHRGRQMIDRFIGVPPHDDAPLRQIR